MSDEEAKAAQEIAKATGKGIDASRELGGFFGKVFGGGVQNLGGAFGDWAFFYRYKNALMLRDKVNALHTERGLEEIMPIPLRLALPFIEKASEEDNEELQDMWARLLANANDKNSDVDMTKTFIDILASIEPLDAKIIDYIGIAQDNTLAELIQNIDASEEEIRLSISNLYRLSCFAILSYTTEEGGARIGPFTVTKLEHSGLHVLSPHSQIAPNELGRAFYKAVSDTSD